MMATHPSCPTPTINTTRNTCPSSKQQFLLSSTSGKSPFFVCTSLFIPLSPTFPLFHSPSVCPPILFSFLLIFSLSLCDKWVLIKADRAMKLKRPMASYSFSLSVALTYLKQILNSVACLRPTSPGLLTVITSIITVWHCIVVVKK